LITKFIPFLLNALSDFHYNHCESNFIRVLNHEIFVAFHVQFLQSYFVQTCLQISPAMVSNVEDFVHQLEPYEMRIDAQSH